MLRVYYMHYALFICDLSISRVAVLDNGHVVEYDSPSKLLADKESMFYSMSTEAAANYH